MKKFLLLFVMSIFSTLYAQNTFFRIDFGGTRQVCDAVFTDDGDTTAVYRNNVRERISFRSLYPSMLHLKFTFTDFDVDPSDTLFVYEGLDTLGHLIGKYNNSNVIAPFIVQSSYLNTSSAFTFYFRSDNSGTGRGWLAHSECTYICQRVNAVLSQAECNPAPILQNNYHYIDLCLYDTLTLAALGSGVAAFPDNDLIYHQDGTSCSYTWQFSDGVTDTGRVVKHKFIVPYGYNIQLNVIDARGCESINRINLRIRVPGLDLNLPGDNIHICSGDTLAVRFGDDSSTVFTMLPYNFQSFSSFIQDTLMFVPDGPNCPQQCLISSLNILSPLIIRSADDIESICIGMEHSYSGDLGFRIICPNGNSVVLDPNSNSGGSYLGTPYGGANHMTYDNGCDPANNPAGTPDVYGWSTFYNTPETRTLDWLSSNGGQIISPTDTVNKTYYIYPANSFSGLIGCPVNGIWKLEICDYYAIDNGYLFWWELNLTSNHFNDSIWSFTTVIDSVVVQGQGVQRLDSFDFNLFPGILHGVLPYHVITYDNFGCHYDNNFQVEVVETPQLHLVPDTTGCYLISLSVPGIYSSYLWSIGSPDSGITVNASDIYTVYVTNDNPLISCSSFGRVNVHMLPSPVIKGQVFYNSDTVKFGRANLINYSDLSLQSYDSLSANGTFEFRNFPSGSYYLQVVPSTLSYPGSLPWYYNDALSWWDADTLMLDCSGNVNVAVNILNMQNHPVGNGVISGYVYRVYPNSSLWPVTGTEIYNQDVNLLNVYDVASTDNTGYYSFDSLGYGIYKVQPELMLRGLLNEYIINYDSRTNNFPNRNFYIYGDTVFSYNPVGINEITPDNEQGLIIYPNPAENILNIYTANTQNNESELTIFDVNGRSLQSSKFSGNKATIDVSRLESGIYFLRIKNKSSYDMGKFIKN